MHGHLLILTHITVHAHYVHGSIVSIEEADIERVVQCDTLSCRIFL